MTSLCLRQRGIEVSSPMWILHLFAYVNAWAEPPSIFIKPIYPLNPFSCCLGRHYIWFWALSILGPWLLYWIRRLLPYSLISNLLQMKWLHFFRRMPLNLCLSCIEAEVFTPVTLLYQRKDGGICLIMDFKNLNIWVAYKKFRMTSIQSILSLLNRDAWMVTIVLKDVYFHINIAPEHHKYLQFKWQPLPI